VQWSGELLQRFRELAADPSGAPKPVTHFGSPGVGRFSWTSPRLGSRGRPSPMGGRVASATETPVLGSWRGTSSNRFPSSHRLRSHCLLCSGSAQATRLRACHRRHILVPASPDCSQSDSSRARGIAGQNAEGRLQRCARTRTASSERPDTITAHHRTQSARLLLCRSAGMPDAGTPRFQASWRARPAPTW
jgi:hypothetical protein